MIWMRKLQYTVCLSVSFLPLYVYRVLRPAIIATQMKMMLLLHHLPPPPPSPTSLDCVYLFTVCLSFAYQWHMQSACVSLYVITLTILFSVQSGFCVGYCLPHGVPRPVEHCFDSGL